VPHRSTSSFTWSLTKQHEGVNSNGLALHYSWVAVVKPGRILYEMGGRKMRYRSQRKEELLHGNPLHLDRKNHIDFMKPCAMARIHSQFCCRESDEGRPSRPVQRALKTNGRFTTTSLQGELAWFADWSNSDPLSICGLSPRKRLQDDPLRIFFLPLKMHMNMCLRLQVNKVCQSTINLWIWNHLKSHLLTCFPKGIEWRAWYRTLA
jgi:hypothetical protein